MNLSADSDAFCHPTVESPPQIHAPKKIAGCYAADQGFAENKARSLSCRYAHYGSPLSKAEFQRGISEICGVTDGR